MINRCFVHSEVKNPSELSQAPPTRRPGPDRQASAPIGAAVRQLFSTKQFDQDSDQYDIKDLRTFVKCRKLGSRKPRLLPALFGIRQPRFSPALLGADSLGSEANSLGFILQPTASALFCSRQPRLYPAADSLGTILQPTASALFCSRQPRLYPAADSLGSIL